MNVVKGIVTIKNDYREEQPESFIEMFPLDFKQMKLLRSYDENLAMNEKIRMW